MNEILKETKEQPCGENVLGREHRIWKNAVRRSGLACSQKTVLEYSKRGGRMDQRSKGRGDDVGPCQPLVRTLALL